MIDLRKIPKTEFGVAVAQIAGERDIDIKVVLDSVEAAALAAFKRDAKEKGQEIDEETEYRVKLDSESGEIRVFLVKGDKEKDVTPPGFGRIAAQTAKQVILQKIREAEKEAVLGQFKSRVGSLISGVVLRFDGFGIVVGVGKGEALMPREEQARGENYHSSQRLVFYIKEIKEVDEQNRIIVSRSAPELVTELFRREVPEVGSGAVEIKAVARRAGGRTKIAVASTQPGIDPVGSCVGQKGIRVQSVIRELGDEKVDVIPYFDDTKQFIVAALSPADKIEVIEINKENKTAKVKIDDDQLAIAIGDGGENVGLAGQLVGFRIEILGAQDKGERKKVSVKKDKTEGKDKKEETN